MKDVDREEFEILLSVINSISMEIGRLEIRGEFPDVIGREIVNGNEVIEGEAFYISEKLRSLKSYLAELRSRKAKLESSRDFSGIESKYNDALKVDREIKRQAKNVYRNMSRTWTAISHPALDSMAWICNWIRGELNSFDVVADEKSIVEVGYSVNKSTGLGAKELGSFETVTVFKKFTLMDIVTNRYLQDHNVKSANIGTVSIRWDKSYPQRLIDRLTSGKVADEHEAALTQHLALPDTNKCIGEHFRQKMMEVAQAYLATSTRKREFESIVKDFIAGRLSAKPVYAAGEILNRMFLIPGADSEASGIWGVLCSISERQTRFVELPRSRLLQFNIVKSNEAWLCRHLPLSARRSTTFCSPFIADQSIELTLNERLPSIYLSMQRSSMLSNEASSTERIMVDDYVEVIRSDMDYMTASNSELWVDWFVEKASIAGLVVSLALVPAAIAGVPYMFAAGIATAAVTAVLPNIAKIYVNKSSEKQREAVKEILLALTLEAIGFGISMATIRVGASIAKRGSRQLASQTVDAVSADMRAAIGRAIGEKTLSIVPKSVGENLDAVLNYIDDLDIALELTRGVTETKAPWHHFGMELSNVELDSFLLKWGAQKANEAGEISGLIKLNVETVEPVLSTSAKITIDGNIDRGAAT